MSIPNSPGGKPSVANIASANIAMGIPSMQDVCLLPEITTPTVNDNRPFQCTICGNRFRQQCHLTQHIRIHTNDRPYHCSHCEKAFKQKSQLNQHERIHTGEKPYQCHLCAKAFPQAGQLYSHKKTHGINPRVTKDPPEGADVPRRGRKRKNKNPSQVVLAPPPVAYLIESLHRPGLPPQYDHLSSVVPTKERKIRENSKHQLQVTDPLPPPEKPQRLEDLTQALLRDDPLSTVQNRQRLIPVTRDQYQHFLQNQQLFYHHPEQYQQHYYQRPESSRETFTTITTSLPPATTLTQSVKNFKASEAPGKQPETQTANVKVEEIPSHLKDLERLIPSYEQT